MAGVEKILHRVDVSGKIKPDTPKCVIYEVLRCLGMDIEWDADDTLMIRTISKCVAPEVKMKDSFNEMMADDLSKVAQFVNPDTRWSTRSLEKAYRHLSTFYDEKIDLPEKMFTVGQKTRNYPLAYNACMLYRICTHHGIVTTREMTMEQMGQSIRMMTTDVSKLRKKTLTLIKGVSKINLVNLLNSPELITAQSPNIKNDGLVSDSEVEEKSESTYSGVESEQIEELSKMLYSINYLLSRITPKTEEEAVFLGGIVHGIDFSEARSPIKQYTAFKSSGRGYTPVGDPEFAKKYTTNPGWYDLRTTWRPVMQCMYKDIDMRRFVQAEGFREEDLTTASPIELMNLSRVTPTFYLNRHPTCDLTRTAIELEEVQDIHPMSVLTYGIASENKWVLFKVSGLTGSFNACKSYNNPCDAKEVISLTAIRKLRRIAESTVSSGFSKKIPPAVVSEYRSLLRTLDEVDLYTKATSKHAKDLSVLHSEYPEEVEDCLTKILHAAFYMRGWKVDGNDRYPISREDTQFRHSLQPTVDKNTTVALTELDQSVDALPSNLRRCIRSLPLMGIGRSNGELVFRTKSQAAEGRTIFGRIDIVKEGTSPYSCIRMSSNYLAISAYYYMTACKMKLPFDIEQLSDIT